MIKNKKGFTLIEVLIVVAIIGILASIVLVGLRGGRGAALDSRRVAELRQIQNSLELYFNSCGIYPIDTDLAGADVALNYDSLKNGFGGGMSCAGGGAAPIVQLPNDSRVVAAGTLGAEGDYMYSSGDGSSYILGTILDGTPPPGYQTPLDVTTVGPLFSSGAITSDCITVSTVSTALNGKNVYCVSL